MSQQDVYEFLHEHSDKWLTTTEIGNGVGITRGAVQNACRKLKKHGEIDMKIIKRGAANRLFQYKFLGEIYE